MRNNLIYFFLISLVILGCKSKKQMISADKSEYILNVADYGSVADGKSDDSKAFQKAIEEAKRKNVRLIYVPPARYFFENTVVIDIEGIKIYSEGGLSYQNKPSWYVSGKKGLKTLFSIVDSEDNNMSFEMEGINFYSPSLGNGPKSAIEINTSYEKPSRSFTLSKCSFSGFESCIHFNSVTKDNRYTWGFVNILDNVFYNNTYSILATSGILSLRFERNESEQGGRIKGHIWGNIWIINNNLEGQSNPIDIKAPGPGYVYLAHNYYESNMSSDAINKFSFGEGESQVKVGPNFNMFETKNFLSVEGAKVIFEGEGDIGNTFVFPGLQNTLSFFNKVSLGQAFTIPIVNVSQGRYPLFAAIVEEENIKIRNTKNSLTPNNNQKDAKIILSYGKKELVSDFSFSEIKIKAGNIVKILVPYHYVNSNPNESFYMVIKEHEGGKTSLSSGYLSNVNSSTKSKGNIFYCFVAPYDLNGLDVTIAPFASQSAMYPTAQFYFEGIDVFIQDDTSIIFPEKSK